MSKGKASATQASDAPRFLLDNLSDAGRAAVMEAGEEKLFANGDYLLIQGEPSEGIVIILQGLVESIYKEPGGRELTLAYWSRGDFVGAPNILGDRPQMWAAKAIGPVHALWLSADTIKDLVKGLPEFALAVIGCLSFKAECYAKLAQTLATHSVDRRLAEVLLSYGAAYGDTQQDTMTLGKMRQRDLAKMVGATRQSVSLALKRLQKQQLIEIGPTKMVLKRLSSLRRLSLANE